MELGNAFTEINDPDEQAERFALQAQEVGGEPGDPDYVEALSYRDASHGRDRPRRQPPDDGADRP